MIPVKIQKVDDSYSILVNGLEVSRIASAVLIEITSTGVNLLLNVPAELDAELVAELRPFITEYPDDQEPIMSS